MAGVQELSCKELVELVTDYLEGALSDRDRARFDEHLVSCPYFRMYLEQMRQTIRTVGHLREEAFPPEAVAALLALFGKGR
jgi:predicted anti-sigma-YlaC factor YlaD